MKPLIPTLSLQVTYQCNIECRHCGPYCGPTEKAWMTVDEIKDLGTHTMNEEMGEEVVKSRVRCATLALGTVQAAIDQFRKEQRIAGIGGKPDLVTVRYEG